METNFAGAWGRSVKPNFIAKLGIYIILFVAPSFALLFNLSVTKYDGSLIEGLKNISLNYIYENFSLKIVVYLWTWIIFQMILSQLPDMLHFILLSYKGGMQEGQLTPAGYILKYNINGLQAWLITHILAIYLVKNNYIDGAILAKNWSQLFIGANIIGFWLALFAYIKALGASSYPKDNKWSGSFIYDYAMGVEFNPRFGNFDFKLFFNGRPGILAWTLINLSFAYYQYEKFGYVTDSMILVNMLQGLYVIDFFWNENWYLKTIDIAHDHFGWYLAWGDCLFLPFIYTLQGAYLMHNDINLGFIKFITILSLGFFGYIIFRWTNYQKDYFRRTENPKIWFKDAKYIECEYKVSSGKIYKSKLLCSGLWSLARHMNYTGDLILSLCYCLACGFNHILPYFYIIFMLILLISRCYRDEDRCSKKYGATWHLYCKKVPYRLIPYIF